MGVFKEEAYTFETIESKQTRIYNDACDYGYSYNTNDIPNELQEFINSINGIKKLDAQFPNEIPLIRNREVSDNSVKLTIRIAWEIDEGYYCGTEYVFEFCKIVKIPSLINKNHNAFISVDMTRYKEPVK